MLDRGRAASGIDNGAPGPTTNAPAQEAPATKHPVQPSGRRDTRGAPAVAWSSQHVAPTRARTPSSPGRLRAGAAWPRSD